MKQDLIIAKQEEIIECLKCSHVDWDYLDKLESELASLKQDKPEKAVNFMQIRELTDEEWLKLPKEEILQLYKNCYAMLQNYIMKPEKSVPLTAEETHIDSYFDEKPKEKFLGEVPVEQSKLIPAEILKDNMNESLWTFINNYPVAHGTDITIKDWIVDAMKEYASQFQPKEIVLPSDKEIVKWANSLEKIEDAMPGTLKLHIQKKIECRIEGAKWLRNLIEKQKGVITSKDLTDIDQANDERK